MRIIYLGDFIKNNGPSVIDNKYREHLNSSIDVDVKYIQSTNLFSIILFIFRFDSSQILFISGISFGGLILTLYYRLIGKKVVLLMHGTIKYESKYRKIPKKRLVFEKLLIKYAHEIYVVSGKLYSQIKKYYSDENKVKVQYNGIDYTLESSGDYEKSLNIITVGGGRKQKRVLDICKAIEQLNNPKIKLIVVGEEIEDHQEIKKFPFVDFIGFVDFNILKKLYKKSKLFVLYSTFESFSSSLFEAINCGCNIICSNNIGALELFPKELVSKMKIQKDSINELSYSIHSGLYSTSNEIKMFVLQNNEKFGWPRRAQQLINKWKELIDE